MRGGQWRVYVLRCGDGTLYCGVTNDLKKRVEAHRAGRGARFTRGRGPLRLVRSWVAGGRGEALRAEAWFKRLTREEKWRLVRGGGGEWVQCVASVQDGRGSRRGRPSGVRQG